MTRHVLVLLGCTILLTGCATILDSSHESISIDSDPQGADVAMTCAENRTVLARTPALVQIGRREGNCLIDITKAGYQPERVTLEQGLNRRILWNLLGIGVGGAYMAGNTDYGGLGGLAAGLMATAGGFTIDWISGRNNDHDPKRIRVTLQSDTTHDGVAELPTFSANLNRVLAPSPAP